MDKFLLVLQLEDKERNLLDGICLGTYGYRILTLYYKHYRNYNIQFQLDHLYKEGFCGIYHNNILKKFLNYTWKKKVTRKELTLINSFGTNITVVGMTIFFTNMNTAI